MSILKELSSADKIADTDIRNIRKFFELNGGGRRISSMAEEIQIKHTISQIELINAQINEIDKKTEEFSVENNSPIHTRNFSFL